MKKYEYMVTSIVIKKADGWPRFYLINLINTAMMVGN